MKPKGQTTEHDSEEYKPKHVGYRLTLREIDTDRELWGLRVSGLRLWLMGMIVVTVIAVVLGAVVLGTPLSYLLPGYLKPEERHSHVTNTLRIDSLQEMMDVQSAYLRNIAAIMHDEIAVDSVEAGARRLITPVTDTLIAASENEKQFVKSWEERERYSLNVLTPVASDRMTMVRPVPMGRVDTVITDDYMPQMLIAAPKGSAVGTIYAGTVIGTGYDVTGGYNVTVQHAGEFVSVYSGLASLMAETGDKIRSGQAVGRSGDRRVGVTIWHRGAAVDPRVLLPY